MTGIRRKFQRLNPEADIKDVQTITISFITRDESKSTSLLVYLNENGDKVLGIKVEDNDTE